MARKRGSPQGKCSCASRGPARMDWGQKNCRAIQLRTGRRRFACSCFLPLLLWLLQLLYSPCAFQGSDRWHGGPFIYQWAESASICRIYTYELRSRSPPRNSRYATPGSFSLLLFSCRAICYISQERYFVTRLLGKVVHTSGGRAMIKSRT